MEAVFEPKTPAPPKAPRHPSEDEMSRGLRWSLGFHAALFVFAVFKSLVFPGKPEPYIPTLRVDIVGLPDVLKKDLSKISKTPATTEEIAEVLKKAEIEAKKIKPIPIPKEAAEPADSDEMVLKPKKATDEAQDRQDKMKGALARIKSLEKIKSFEKPENTKVIKGNAISKGTSLSGEAKENALSSYYDVLRDRLQENWALPVWLARQNFSAQVLIFVDSRGRLHSFRFIKSSGSSQFDDAIKNTLTQSQPFPVPPQELASALLSDGITVGFPL